MINRRTFFKYSANVLGFSILPNVQVREHPFLQYAKDNFKLLDSTRGIVNFEQYNYHEPLLNAYDTKNRILVKKYRQGGFSIFNALYALYECLTKENQSFLFVCKTDRECCYTSSKIHSTIEYMPNRPNIDSNDHRISFENGNIIRFLTAERTIGYSWNRLFIDEFAFFQDAEATLKRLAPLSKQIIITSTPNGKRNYFHKLYKTGEFTKFSPNYINHPFFQDAKEIRKNLGEVGWRSEIITEFV